MICTNVFHTRCRTLIKKSTVQSTENPGKAVHTNILWYSCKIAWLNKTSYDFTQILLQYFYIFSDQLNIHWSVPA